MPKYAFEKKNNINFGVKMLGVVPVLMLISCSQLEGPIQEENACINQELISSIKNDIRRMASNEARKALGNDDYDFSAIDLSDITFDLISEPSIDDNGDITCTATVHVIYQGSEDTVTNLADRVSHFAENGVPSDGGIIVDALFNINTLRRIHDIGINGFSISEFSNLVGNSFNYNIEYQIRRTYNESGDSQESYLATSVAPAKMLATFFSIDKYLTSLSKPKPKTQQLENPVSIEQTTTHDDSYSAEVDTYNYEDDEDSEQIEEESEEYLNSTFEEMDKKGLLTDKFGEEQFEWSDQKIAECGEDAKCNSEKNFSRADELRKKHGIPLGG